MDGKWQPWSLWSGCSKTCGGGRQQRNRMCYGPFFEGKHCPGEREEVRHCNEKRCPGEWIGKLFVLSAWGQHPFHVWVTYSVCKSSCTCLMLTEPHEICGEDNFSNVVWKMTPAGDTAAVRCPPNAMGKCPCFNNWQKVLFKGFIRQMSFRAVLISFMCRPTGLILRRCSLDEEGIAYWENSTYMKCISNDYRSIQTLVSISDLFPIFLIQRFVVEPDKITLLTHLNN